MCKIFAAKTSGENKSVEYIDRTSEMKFERNSLVSINIFQRNICLSVEMERFSRDSTRNHLEISNLSPGECKFDKRGGRKSRKEQGSTLVEKEKDRGRKLTRKATREGESEEEVGS